MQVAEQMSDYLVKGAVSNAINMPSISAEEAPRLRPFVKLAEVLGAFVGQATDEPIKEVEILFDGSTANMNTKALISAALAGLMRPQMPEVNMVSAPSWPRSAASCCRKSSATSPACSTAISS